MVGTPFRPVGSQSRVLAELARLWDQAAHRAPVTKVRVTQTELAKQSRVPIQTVNSWAKGASTPRDLDQLTAVGRVLAGWAGEAAPMAATWGELKRMDQAAPPADHRGGTGGGHPLVEMTGAGPERVSVDPTDRSAPRSSAAPTSVKASQEVVAQVPPIEFIGRREVLATLRAVLRNPQIPLITLKGMGGIGKTALAQEAVRKLADENLFNSIFWRSTQTERFIGEGVVRTEVADYSFDALLDDLLRHSQLAWSADAPTVAKEQIVRNWLAGSDNKVLIVLDNLETVPNRDALVASLIEILGRGKILVTSRYSVLRERAFSLDLEGLSPQDGIAFLVRTAERQNNRNLMSAATDTLARIRDVAGGAPLAMQLISGQMDYQPVEQVLRVVEEAGFNNLSYEFYSFLFRRIWDELDGPARKVLVAMRHFEGNPTASAIQHTANVIDDEFYSATARLGQRSMLAMMGGREVRYSLHPLTRYFINTDIVARWE
ncbi:NB-ARC domain-containing protein [Streptomyces sp. NBC_00996]|uniref:NB-ARC domain-containing protein n=1 Tax=Streptomyces sp. NBC_00996 TaxID=2903710 RepID=UPI00386A2156|nr:NB-ARC domain-containing protein [Streptomyces sp. NBC_00996]